MDLFDDEAYPFVLFINEGHNNWLDVSDIPDKYRKVLNNGDKSDVVPEYSPPFMHLTDFFKIVFFLCLSL